MSYCPRCGTQIGTNDAYCRGCGGKLNKPKVDRVWKTCEFCKGTGKDPGDGNVIAPSTCRVCNGAKGRYFAEEPRPCGGECKGNGRIKVPDGIEGIPNYRPCRDCGGWGWVESK